MVGVSPSRYAPDVVDARARAPRGADDRGGARRGGRGATVLVDRVRAARRGGHQGEPLHRPEEAQIRGSAAALARSRSSCTRGSTATLKAGSRGDRELDRPRERVRARAGCARARGGRRDTASRKPTSVKLIAKIPGIVELNIGHAVISDAVFLSLAGAVKRDEGGIARALICRRWARGLMLGSPRMIVGVGIDVCSIERMKPGARASRGPVLRAHLQRESSGRIWHRA
jgi:hypothetical protein